MKEIKDSALNIIEIMQTKSILNDYHVRDNLYITNDRNYRDQLRGIKERLQKEQVFHEILKDYNELYKFAQKVVDVYIHYTNNRYFLPHKLDIGEMSKILQQLSDANTTKKDEDEKSISIFEDYLDSKPEIKIEYHTELFIPKIIDYDNNHKFKNKDLITHPDNIEKSIFFNTLLNAINKTTSGIKSVYEKAKSSTPGYLTKSEEGLNKRIADVIADRFNKIYGKRDDDNYRFDMRLGKDEISLSIFKGNDVVVLDDQSAGFKWFFNLYFNLLNGKILQSGDIVLMDEPAHNLSPKARKECADFLRKYGEENGITFMIITHDVFWVNPDYLNELRIIKNREDKELKGICIQNDFSRIQESDSDTLLSIKNAFGVGSNVFYPVNTKIISVEGITDYNYFTTFKLLWEKENETTLDIVFLPMFGLGKAGEREIVLGKLIKQFEHPILLMDSDIYDEIVKIKEVKQYKQLEIIKLGDIESSFKEVEDIFSENDKEKYGLTKKSYGISASFKKHILWNDGQVEQDTKQNFYKVLQTLVELTKHGNTES